MSGDSRDAGSSPVVGPFVQGLIATLAMGSLMSSGGGNFNQVMPIAFGMALIAAFSTWGDWFGFIAGIFYSALGVIASIPTMAHFVTADRCTGYPPTAFRVASLVLLVLLFGLSAFASGIFRGGLPAAATGLALYGAIEILVKSASFLAGGRYSGDWIAMSVMVLGAPVLGWFVVASPTAVLAVAGVVFTLHDINESTQGSACRAANPTAIPVIVMFCMAYGAFRFLGGMFSRNHAGRRGKP